MKLIKALSFALITAVSMPAFAEKVAVLGVQEALLASNAAKAFRDSLQAELAGDQDKLVGLEKQAKAAQDKMKKNQGLVSDEEFAKLRLQFQKVYAEYNKRGQALQQRRAKAEQQFLVEMRPKLDKVIRGLIESQNYDLVVAKQATLFAKKELDITAKVVELLNKQ